MLAAAEPSWLSILPAVVAIVLAFATRQVLLALFAGVMTGSVVVLLGGGSAAEANPLTRFFFPAIGTSNFAQILLVYLWCLGGLIGLWNKTGGAQHFATVVGHRVAKGPRTARLFAWVVGIVFHQGGTVSTVLAGSTVKPVSDRHRVSHEELAYIVDSTASPIATVLPFNAWPVFVAPLILGTIPMLTVEAEEGQTAVALGFYFDSIRYNFYGIFAALGTLLFSLGLLPWCGRRMQAARQRALTTGALDGPGAEPLLDAEVDATGSLRDPGYAPSLWDFFAPIGVLLTVAIVPYVLYQLEMVDQRDSNWIFEAFALAVLTAMLVARARGMSLRSVLDGFVQGCQAVTIGALILALAVTLGTVSKELDTAGFVVTLVGDMPRVLLPASLTFLCMGIAFATGSSWGTYAVVFPVAMPLAWAVHPDVGFAMVCFGSVLGGSVFGDQCSPISDTTILSSMFTGCDVMDHVRTQLPLAFAIASIGAVASTLCVL